VLGRKYGDWWAHELYTLITGERLDGKGIAKPQGLDELILTLRGLGLLNSDETFNTPEKREGLARDLDLVVKELMERGLIPSGMKKDFEVQVGEATAEIFGMVPETAGKQEQERLKGLTKLAADDQNPVYVFGQEGFKSTLARAEEVPRFIDPFELIRLATADRGLNSQEYDEAQKKIFARILEREMKVLDWIRNRHGLRMRTARWESASRWGRNYPGGMLFPKAKATGLPLQTMPFTTINLLIQERLTP